MELRQYWHIVWKRVWIIVALLVVVLIGSLALRAEPAPLYQATLRFTVGVPPESRTGDYYTYDRYYTWLTSEYIADDFSEVVKSQAFAEDVSAILAEKQEDFAVPAGAIQGSTVAEKQHRILTVRITWGDPGQLQAIAEAAEEALREKSGKYFAQLGSEGATVYVIDKSPPMAVGRSLRERLDLPIRLFLALLAGVALTFLLDYLDDTVRDGAELEAMGITVLGEIPRRSREPGIRKPWLKLRSALRR
jgi:capsular polysaccharide biosynthesis protein